LISKGKKNHSEFCLPSLSFLFSKFDIEIWHDVYIGEKILNL